MAGRTILPRANVSRLDDWSPQLLKSRLYGQLLVDIIVGRLAPGERLDERALAKRYGGGLDGGGLAGIREALARLALEGLVIRRARVGTMVAALDLMEARETFAARALVEIECAGLASRFATEADIAAIRATLDDGESAITRNDVRALAAMDEAFHVAVAQASHNRVLAKMVMTLHHQTARFWLNAMREPSLDENRRALSEHRALADAIASRDGTKAREAMRQSLGDFPSDIKRAWGTP
ncbi:MAG TPA: GntR family transcriptional regulator [Rhizomicrobium sp.]|nr:GntR family transcriptional regulator [Rhizomicrobium sp.]